MAVLLHHIVIDAHDLPTLARFWTQMLGWRILSEREREIVIGAAETAPVGICFMPVTDQKIVKNRVHLDLTTGAEERDAEIERILALGARHLLATLVECVAHYNGHRPHQARQQLPPNAGTAPPPITDIAARRVRRLTILNGLISEYAQAA